MAVIKGSGIMLELISQYPPVLKDFISDLLVAEHLSACYYSIRLVFSMNVAVFKNFLQAIEIKHFYKTAFI
jgi:hypothetical protein